MRSGESCSIAEKDSNIDVYKYNQLLFFSFYLPKMYVRVTGPLALWVECSPVVWETGVQSQVESYKRL